MTSTMVSPARLRMCASPCGGAKLLQAGHDETRPGRWSGRPAESKFSCKSLHLMRQAHGIMAIQRTLSFGCCETFHQPGTKILRLRQKFRGLR